LPKVALFSPTYIVGAKGKVLYLENRNFYFGETLRFGFFLALFCGDKPIIMAHCPPSPKKEKVEVGRHPI
jgi:hypothetical protein